MTSWAARAKVHFSHEGQEATPKTTETVVMGVMGGYIGHPCEELNFLELAANDPSGLVPDSLANLVVDEVDDSDLVCWPHSTAMNGEEIDNFTARLARFAGKGVGQIDAECLADKLVIRDREADDRRLCLECKHLTGMSVKFWRCANWEAAGVAHRARDMQLPADLVIKLQRCPGFVDLTRKEL